MQKLIATPFLLQRGYDNCLARDLHLSMSPGAAGSIEAVFEFNASLFQMATIQSMADHFLCLTQSAAMSPEKKLGDLEMLSAQEKELVLYKWNKTSQPFPSEKCIHHLVEEQVKCTPEAAAIQVADGCTMSYATMVWH